MNSRIIWCALLLAAAPRFACAGIEYSVQNIGHYAPDGSDDLYTYAINGRGHAVGQTNAWIDTPTFYNGGSIATILFEGYRHGSALDVNDNDQIVGVELGNSDLDRRGFVWQNGTVTYIPNAIDACGINASGQIVGRTYDGHGYRYTNGAIEDLGADVFPFKINASGVMAGNGGTDWDVAAFVRSGSGWVSLGALGRGRRAWNINDSGQIVGDANSFPGRPTYETHAFLYEGGAIHDLSTAAFPCTTARGINSAGVIVGSAGPSSGAVDAAVYRNGEWTRLTDLVDPAYGLRSWQAWDINDAGQIAVLGIDATYPTVSGYSTYILTPIPEASSLGALGLLASGLLRRRARRM